MNQKDLLRKFGTSKNFINRDLSWIEFNRRVMHEALNPDLPLLEKVKFVSIFSSNLDEFYMIRVSGIKDQIEAKLYEQSIDGLTPLQQMKMIDRLVRPMLDQVLNLWKNEIVPNLKANDIYILQYNELNEKEKKLLTEYFKKEIYPILTPLALDPGRPFPYISNLSLNLAVQVKKNNGETHFARVKVPNILPRLLQIDRIIGSEQDKKDKYKFVWLGDLIKDNLGILFLGVEILEAHRFRITRDTDVEIQEDEADDLLHVIEENIRQRKFGNVVRLEIEKSMPQFMIDILTTNLQLAKDYINIVDGPIALSDVIRLYDLPCPEIKEAAFHPVMPRVFEEEENIFELIKQKDILLHHPFHSFNPVIDFIKAATKDPDVLAIKQTLYRVGHNSPIVKCLIEAAELGKQVAVLVELKARFDEENNIFWARELEKVGVHVVYGLIGLKTHAKMTLVVRRENEEIRKYVHLSSGNYNTVTAKIYTDLGLFTSNWDICCDVADIFNYLTGYSEQKEFRKLFVAPINLREKVLKLISREIENVKAGGKGTLIFKFNSLVDPVLICALYEASCTGVRVELLVRGICCLVPRVAGLSENIRVVSVVGRFLEHSRIYYFYNNGVEEVYISSADLMQRNLDRRVEVMYPIEDKNIKMHIINTILKVYLKDNEKSRYLESNGLYAVCKKDKTEKHLNAQDFFINLIKKENEKRYKIKG